MLLSAAPVIGRVNAPCGKLGGVSAGFITLETLLKTELWHDFERQTRARRRQPADVLADLLRDYLETAANVELNEAMRAEAGTPQPTP